MTAESISPQLDDSSLKKYCVIAFSLHLFIVAFFILGELILAKWNLSFLDLKKRNAIVLASAIRVDVVSMPTLTVKELKTIEPTEIKSEDKPVEVKAPEVKNDEKTAEAKPDPKDFKVEDKKKSFHDLLKKLSKKNIALVKNDEEGKAKKAQNIVISGNKISKGSSLTLGKNSADQEVLVNYISTMADAVRPYWRLPSYLMNKNLNARLRVAIALNGEVISVSIYESSGNSEYDERAKAAIIQGAPYAIPDKEIRDRVIKGDIILGFPL